MTEDQIERRDLRAVLVRAVVDGCDLVMLDRDADPIDGLQLHHW